MKRAIAIAMAMLCFVAGCDKLKPTQPAVEVSISLNKSELTLREGESETLSATVKPDEAPDKTVTWSSSDPSVAQVDNNGKVTAVKAGTATITAKAGGKSVSCRVTVSPKDIPVTSVTLDKIELTLTEGESATFVITLKPENTTITSVTWSTSNKYVVELGGNGMITAVGEGTAIITIKAGDQTASCTVTVKKKPVPATSVTLNKTTLTLTEGGSETLTATVKPSNTTEGTVTWTSSDTSIATVDNNGKVTAVKEGTATITAKAGEKSASCTVTVKKKLVAVTSVTLNKTTLTLTEGDSETLTATIKPDNATDKTVTWSTSSTSIATVDNNGKVTAVKEGTATITAKAGEKSASCTITVKKKLVAVTSVTLNKTTLTLTEGGSETLAATVKPDNATDKTVTWSSSSASIATVDNNGKVTAVKEGTATITAKAGDKSATCTVTVKKKVIAVSSVTLSKTTLTLTEGDTQTLTATVKPDNATDKTVTWSTSSASIATVDNNGKVTAVKEGTATITAKAGDKSATCKVTVNKKIIPVSSVSLDKTELTLKAGATETLTATVNPDNATNKKVSWSSSNTSIAKVDSYGKVTAVKEGTATITADVEGKKATCTVSVYTGVTSITLNVTTLKLKQGQLYQLTATVKPNNATYPEVTWSSSNSSVVAVDTNGHLTAKQEGTATIRAKVKEGLTAECAVTVSNTTEGGGHEGTGEEVWY